MACGSETEPINYELITRSRDRGLKVFVVSSVNAEAAIPIARATH